MEAFSDGVLAIIITIMVLEIKVPHGSNWEALGEVLPIFLSYVLSFIYIGIYWNNHHHMLQMADKVNGPVLWANLHLLFWLSLVPFVTGWMGENHFTTLPTALYGFILFMAGLAYFMLQQQLIKLQGPGSQLKKAIGKDVKGKLSPILYLLSIVSAWWHPWISGAFFIGVALMWLVPDKRIERNLPPLEED